MSRFSAIVFALSLIPSAAFCLTGSNDFQRPKVVFYWTGRSYLGRDRVIRYEADIQFSFSAGSYTSDLLLKLPSKEAYAVMKYSTKNETFPILHIPWSRFRYMNEADFQLPVRRVDLTLVAVTQRRQKQIREPIRRVAWEYPDQPWTRDGGLAPIIRPKRLGHFMAIGKEKFRSLCRQEFSTGPFDSPATIVKRKADGQIK